MQVAEIFTTKDKMAKEAYLRAPTYKLLCSMCGKFLCYVYDCDLNGSYFYCESCAKVRCEVNGCEMPTEEA
jgi:hypothetical protein